MPLAAWRAVAEALLTGNLFYSEHRTSEPAWSRVCPAGHAVKAMEGCSELKTVLSEQRKEDVHVPSWDWQGSAPLQHSCAGIFQSRGHSGATTFTLNPHRERQRKAEEEHTEGGT